MIAEAVEEDDLPGCTLRPGQSCYCTRRPGCQAPDDDCLYCGRPDCRGDCDDEE